MFDSHYFSGVSYQPAEPELRHVWVHGPAGMGEPVPGLVLGWLPAPVRNAKASPWIALVAKCPFGSALLVEWVSADRLVGLLDGTPSDDAR